MNKLGILVEDYSGIYLVKQVMEARPGLDYYIIRDVKSPEESHDQYLQKNMRRFRRLKLDQVIDLTRSSGSSTWLQWVEESLVKVKGKVYRWSREAGEFGEVPELIIHALDDGYLGRGYTGYLLEDYLDQVPLESDYLLLQAAGLGRVRPWVEEMARGRKLQLIDPLDILLEDLPDREGQGRSIFYWTERDFPFERRVQEILQAPIEFQIWHDLAWLRRSIEDLD